MVTPERETYDECIERRRVERVARCEPRFERFTVRVLFTCVAATGHFHPLVPVARALADAGHEVAFAPHAAIAPLVERYVPQTLVSPRCDVVLSRGGSGTVMATVAQGLPQVVVPIGADHPYNAARVAALGAGRVIPAESCTTAAVRDAVRAGLGDPAYRRVAEVLRAEIRALPGPEGAVALLEQLVAERRPLAAA
jgi:UDP:flavonoid glycosyltransferase YjiC (YdhE family)